MLQAAQHGRFAMDHQPKNGEAKRNKANNWNSKTVTNIPHTHPLREKAKVNSFLSYQETKQKTLLLVALLVAKPRSRDIFTQPGTLVRIVLAMEREWNVEKDWENRSAEPKKKKTIKCGGGGGGIFGSFRTQWQNEKQNNFAQQLMKLIRRRDPLVHNDSSFTRQQLLDAFEPKTWTHYSRVIVESVLAANNLHFPIWSVQNKKGVSLVSNLD